jgi:hypothetical protein
MTNTSGSDVMQLSPLFRKRDAGPKLDVLGVTHIYKAMAGETGQQFSTRVDSSLLRATSATPIAISAPPRRTSWCSL